jgi:hypothetical protein
LTGFVVDGKQELLGMIAELLSGRSTVEEFWKRFHFYFNDLPENALSEFDEAYFFEVDEALHLTDFSSPADSDLYEPLYFIGWLTEMHGLYLAGKWTADASLKEPLRAKYLLTATHRKRLGLH